MDPYDAIIEQLKKAQQRGVEAVTNRLDFVLESLEGVIQEAREAVQEAIPADAEELFPVMEATQSAESARASLAEMEARIQELQTGVEAPTVRPPEAVSLGLLRRLDAARSQSELLRGLLPLLLDHVGRAAVLVVRDRTISAWSGVGFASGARLGEWKAEASDSEALRRLLDDAAIVSFTPLDDPVFSSWLASEDEPLEGMLVPVSLRGRVVGGFYVDRLEGGAWSPDTVQSLVALTCWLIDTLNVRTTVPSPMLAEPVAVGAQEVAVPPAAAVVPEPEEPSAEAGFEEEEAEAEGEPAVAKDEPTPESGYAPVTDEEPEPAPASEWAPPEAAAPTEAEEPEEPAEHRDAPPAEPPAEERPELRMPAGFDPSATMRVDPGPAIERARAEMETARAAEEQTVEADEAVAEPPAPEPVEDASLEAEAPAPPPVQPYMPPPVKPIVPPPPAEEREGAARLPVSGLSPEEQAQHEEAQRFARLLVSEIKLYNPDEVEKGRSNHDLYQRLKEDIDRSREMYERRVAEQVRSVHDYFQDELVHILADGDGDALGM
ncbi:MAG: hypothetical protein LJE95_02665 [Acidobacteria bacterium]|jgi:hypothetical protein|nr:hypothetical protein [Acidobacteriota bacterium]